MVITSSSLVGVFTTPTCCTTVIRKQTRTLFDESEFSKPGIGVQVREIKLVKGATNQLSLTNAMLSGEAL
jgi:hypothetical protein